MQRLSYRHIILAILFLLGILSPASVRAQDNSTLLNRQYSFDISPAPLIEVLGAIRTHTGVRFIYSPSNLPGDQLVSVSARNTPLEVILNDLLKPVHVEFEVIAGQVALRWNPPEARTAYTQTIRGRVVDKDTQVPLIGAHVFVETTAALRGASTDIDGYFEIPELPLGRHILAVQYIGFTPVRIGELLLTAGKEIVLDIELVSLPLSMDQIVIADEVDLRLPLNEMAVVSARSFSVEQTQRFAASLSDPARMAHSFAGVSRSEDDVLNEVIVRGQSPKHTVWYLEGVEIPNPNHFSDDGHSSGAISMLSSNMLTYSDFYTGAFPAQFSNAIAGVFDINMRKGNASRREHTLSIGALGVEGTVEGPFNGNYDGSYLVNYRYSTLGLLTDLKFINEGDVDYQDLAFKVHLPAGKAGTFSLFGLGGMSNDVEIAARDSSQWGGATFGSDQWVRERRGLLGLKHTHVVSSQAFLSTTLIMYKRVENEELHVVNPFVNYARYFVDEELSRKEGVRGHIGLQLKGGTHHLFQAGFRGGIERYKTLFREKITIPGEWILSLDTKGRALNWSSYAQWTYRPSIKWKYYLGFHVSGFNLNKETIIEPRAGITWQITDNQRTSFATGLYSQLESPGLYTEEHTLDGVTIRPNRQLRRAKSWHNVAEYEYMMPYGMRVKAEAYYNKGYDIPVSDSLGSAFSVVNTYYLYDIVNQTNGLVNSGTMTNYGVDLTLEKLFSGGIYFLLTGSVFESNYTALDGMQRDSRYDTNYIIKLTTGWEVKMGGEKENVLGVNLRSLYSGGNRFTPIDLEASDIRDFEVERLNAPFSQQLSDYYRIDAGISYTMNRPYLTHNFFLDIQNVTNRINEGFVFYDRRRRLVDTTKQLGILPVLGYKLTF